MTAAASAYSLSNHQVDQSGRRFDYVIASVPSNILSAMTTAQDSQRAGEQAVEFLKDCVVTIPCRLSDFSQSRVFQLHGRYSCTRRPGEVSEKRLHSQATRIGGVALNIEMPYLAMVLVPYHLFACLNKRSRPVHQYIMTRHEGSRIGAS